MIHEDCEVLKEGQFDGKMNGFGRLVESKYVYDNCWKIGWLKDGMDYGYFFSYSYGYLKDGGFSNTFRRDYDLERQNVEDAELRA